MTKQLTLDLDHIAFLIDHRKDVSSSLTNMGGKKLKRLIELESIGLMKTHTPENAFAFCKLTDAGQELLDSIIAMVNS